MAKNGNNKSNSSFPASSSSFGVLNLKGDKLYTSSGYKMDVSNNKNLNGNITLYKHGFVFSYKKGFISKSTVEEFYQWKPYIELIADKNKTNLLKIQYSKNQNINDDEKKEFEMDNKIEQMYKFGIMPCRPKEIIEIIQNEINKMYPTYSLQNEIKGFINGINQGNGVNDIINEYNELNTNINQSVNEMNQINDVNDKYNRLQSEINTMNARVLDIQNNVRDIWNKCDALINGKLQPLINDLSAKIDSMVNNNEHWKIISNVRKSLSNAMENKEKLINIQNQIEFIVKKE